MAQTPLTDEDALKFHSMGRPGKLAIAPTKPLTTQRDLSLAYSPGVAVPCAAIARDPELAYDYTSKGNLVAVVSNGTAVLGLGNLGGLASKPVMEGKAVLFKRFADIDGIDLVLDTQDIEEFIAAVKPLAPTFGGINLEDIKAPDCFIIESRLRELMNIPVFHDDQHGTAIIAGAGLRNAMDLTGRKPDDIKIVINGAGAAGIACAELFKAMGVPGQQVVLCDSKGVIYEGREQGMNQWKSAHAVDTPDRTLTEAMRGADVFVGLSIKGAVNQDMIASMAARPIVFALANPDPEILPDEVLAVAPTAIVATGRSDYPNQVNNVLGFPYIFRGALDVRAREINEAMKVAAADALAALTREDVPDEVGAAYSGKRPRFGPDYIIPAPFDPRLIEWVPPAVADAAVATGVARKPIADREAYVTQLRSRLDVTATTIDRIGRTLKGQKKRVIFAEGEDERAIRAAIAFRAQGYGEPILVGRESSIEEKVRELGLSPDHGIEVRNSVNWPRTQEYMDWLYRRTQRRGLLQQDCRRLINTDRNVFSGTMVQLGDADAMVTGLTRSFNVCFDDIRSVIDPLPGRCPFGIATMIVKNRTMFIADTSVWELPDPQTIVNFTIQAAEFARRMGHEPRVALLSFSNFGQPDLSRTKPLKEAMALLDDYGVDFEYEGEMGADFALDYELMQRYYPFSRLTGPANVLIMPGLHVANICMKMVSMLGDATTLGPVIAGLEKPAYIVPMGATVNDVVHMAALAAHAAVES